MLPITATLGTILAANSRNAIAEIIVQGPNPSNVLQAGTQLVLDGVTKLTVQRNEESTSDTIDFEIANPDGRYTPLRYALTGIPSKITTDSYPDALRVGSVNWKTLAFMGLTNTDAGTYSSSIVPQGTFLLQTSDGAIDKGSITQRSHGFDISYSFNFKVNANLPHTLFGNQTDPRYDSNYNLSNPSGDLKTYVCDAQNFMTQVTDNIFLKADFTLLFGQTAPANAVNVYVGTPGSPSSTPVSSSSYTWNPTTGTVTFSTAQASNAYVSIDGVPQSMAPEKMLSHLFADYGHYDSSYFKFQTSNIVLPIYTGGSDTVWRIAQNIAAMTAPRGVKWRLRIDEYGYIQFYEDKHASAPTEVLVDERDFISLNYTLSAEQLANVVRAKSTANNQQPITSISYDIDSITDSGQRDTYEVDSTLLSATRGMPPLLVKSMLDGITASTLTDSVRPILEFTAEVVPNPARQTGDKVTVIEQTLGLSAPYIIKGITRTVEHGKMSEQIRFRRALLYSNYNMGLASAITNVAAPGTTGSASSTSVSANATVVGRTGIIKSVTIGGTNAINLGAVVKDANGSPIIPSVSGASWSFGFSLDPTQNYDTAVWQLFYLECPNTLSSSDLMAIRAGTWVSNDGATISAATIAGGYSQSYTHTTGSLQSNTETAYSYSSLAYLVHPNIVPPSYAANYSNLTYLASTGLSGQIGLGYGSSYLGSYAWLPQQKINYGWYVVCAVNAAGASQIIRCPFTLNA